MNSDEKKVILAEAAELAAAYFTNLIEQRLARNDALDMTNNFVLMFLATKGVIVSAPRVEGDEWKDK